MTVVTRNSIMRRTFALLFLFLDTRVLQAHDFWIEPATFRTSAGKAVPVVLRVGERLNGEPVPRRNDRIARFAVIAGGTEATVSGDDLADPAGTIALPARGTNLIVYESRANSLTYPREKFDQFVREEGVEAIASRHPSASPIVRESFFRYAKAIVCGESCCDETLASRPVGLRLELVPGGNGSFRLLHENKPLSGALVTAIPQNDPQATLRQRTDRDGRVTFRMPPGVWLVKAVHLVRSETGETDWESLWASLTLKQD